MVSKEILNDIFQMERRTLVTLLLLETILLYILLPRLGSMMFVWYGITSTLTLWRLYAAYDYQAHPEHNAPIVWHKKLVIQTWTTALLFSLLALLGIPYLNEYYQRYDVPGNFCAKRVKGCISFLNRRLRGFYRTMHGRRFLIAIRHF